MNKDFDLQLQNLGLSSDEANLYLYIVRQGKKTVSEIRKAFNWSATKTNSILLSDNLSELLMNFIDNGRNYYVIKPLNALKTLVKKNQDLQIEVKNQLHKLKEELSQFETTAPLDSKVINYHGLSGLREILWKTIDSKDPLRFLVYLPNGKYMDYNFYDDIRRIYVERGIRTQEILNAPQYGDFTDVPEFLDLYEGRYLDSKLIKFKHEVLIYNNVYATYRVDKNGIFCTEIYNERLAEMQKQLFDYMWNRSVIMKLISQRGALEVE
jgi:sugar-specific transcriptional regulator TrmB